MDIVPGFGNMLPDWALWALAPFVVGLLIAGRVFQVRDRRQQERRRPRRRSETV